MVGVQVGAVVILQGGQQVGGRGEGGVRAEMTIDSQKEQNVKKKKNNSDILRSTDQLI